MADSMVASFWGPVTSTTELCEENYAHSSYIAEFYNTISNVPCVLLALIGLVNAFRQGFEKRFSVLHISNMILAIGSMIFHATLQHVSVFLHTWFNITYGRVMRQVLVQHLVHGKNLSLQQSDETPMVWEILLYMYVLYSPDWHYRSTMPTFLFLYGAAFAAVHFFARFQVVFKVHYIGLCLLCIPRMYKYYIQTKDVAAKRLAKLWVLSLTLGTLCWLVDRIFCKKLSLWYVNPQGHAWWHILMGLNSYYANTFLMFCRAQQRGWEPRITHLLGFLPYVKVQKPEKRE
ncbi:hypothetical protein U9M48_010236 [Paspalum notatum var. saurae]|uniref:Alkaline phytoceramidase n=1 Tax=Paspalum notatum var. saurae TaxID=547442 RepID=A0AAQ3SSR0_PASNO